MTDALPEVDQPAAEESPPERQVTTSKMIVAQARDWSRSIVWARVLAYGVLPGLTLMLALAAGFAKGVETSDSSAQRARSESLVAAKDSAVALLSYQPDSIDKSMASARDRLTSPYREDYTKLTTDVIIPGARRDHVSVVASVPAAAPVSATPQRAVVVLFVNQTATVGEDPPTTTASSIRVTLQKIGAHWLISNFDPI